MDPDEIRRVYAADPTKEWNRLTSTSVTRTEYMITSHCLERYLPPTGLILDAGSGPGRYAINLAMRGYRVVMLDLVRELLQVGQAKIAEAKLNEQMLSLVQGDIGVLPFASDTFDAVMSLGSPLSHLIDESMAFRITSWSSLVRVHECRVMQDIRSDPVNLVESLVRIQLLL
jgi:2-polyprenyl-3-methyl-5-hydroxy-6-metoxy-1,4-benzoquinol methylase